MWLRLALALNSWFLWMYFQSAGLIDIYHPQFYFLPKISSSRVVVHSYDSRSFSATQWVWDLTFLSWNLYGLPRTGYTMLCWNLNVTQFWQITQSILIRLNIMVHGSDQSEMFSGLVTNEICVVIIFFSFHSKPCFKIQRFNIYETKIFSLNVLYLKKCRIIFILNYILFS